MESIVNILPTVALVIYFCSLPATIFYAMKEFDDQNIFTNFMTGVFLAMFVAIVGVIALPFLIPIYVYRMLKDAE